MEIGGDIHKRFYIFKSADFLTDFLTDFHQRLLSSMFDKIGGTQHYFNVILPWAIHFIHYT